MEISIPLFLVVTGILATIATIRNTTQINALIATFVMAIGVLFLSKDFFAVAGEKSFELPFLLTSILSVHLIIGLIASKIKNPLWCLIPILSTSLLFLIPDLDKQSFMGFLVDDSMAVFLIAILGASALPLLYLFNQLAKTLTNKWSAIEWTEKEDQLFTAALAFLFLGGFAALSGFLIGKVGILIAGTFFLASSFTLQSYFKNTTLLISTSAALFLVTAGFIVLNTYAFDTLDFLRGEVLEGAFMAGFVILVYELIIGLAQKSKGKLKVLLIVKLLLIPLFILLIIGFAYIQLERLGGVLSYASFLFILGILPIFYSGLKAKRSMIGIQLFSLGIILLAAPYFAPVQQSSGINLSELGIENTKKSNSENASSKTEKSYQEKLEEPDGKDLNKALGQWEVDEKASKVFFELGPPKGRTEGEIQKIKGTFKIKEQLSQSQLKITMPVTSLTTFNSMRDESLMSEDYFLVDQFPSFTFQSTDFSKGKENAYDVEGDFTMLGVTKKIIVKLKLVGIGEKKGKRIMVLWGTSVLDRTNFGMEPSEKTGDIVDFHYEVQLVEQ